MWGFQGNSEQMQVQVRTLLADRDLFDFLCRKSFNKFDTEGHGALSLPAVAPLIQSLRQAAGLATSAEAEYSIWRRHCDPVMNHMTVDNFLPFAKNLLQDFLDECQRQADARRQAAVHRPSIDIAPPQRTERRPAPPPPNAENVSPPPAVQNAAEATGAPATNVATRPPSDSVAATSSVAGADSAVAGPDPGSDTMHGATEVAAVVPANAGSAEMSEQADAKPAAVVQDPRSSPPPPSGGSAKASGAPPSDRQGSKKAFLKVPGTEGASALAPSKPASPAASPKSGMLPGPAVIVTPPPELDLGPSADPAKQPDAWADPDPLLAQSYSLLPREAVANCPNIPEKDHYFEERKTVLSSLEAALQVANRLVDEAEASSRLFEDPEFGPRPGDPSAAKDLYRNDPLPAEETKSLPKVEDVEWLRPSEIRPARRLGLTGQLCRLMPGVFHDGWLLGALGVLSMRRDTIFGAAVSAPEEPLGIFPQVFWNPRFRRHGLYCCRFNKYGQWLYVIVDDRLPVMRTGHAPLFAQGFDSAGEASLLWPALVEKAYAKLHCGYSSLWSGFVDDALEDMTSWPTEKLQVSRYTSSATEGALGPTTRKTSDLGTLWDLLSKELKDKSIVACSKVDTARAASEAMEKFGQQIHVDAQSIGLAPSPEGDIVGTGLLRNSAYAVLLLQEVQTSDGEKVRLVRLRDVLGCGGGGGLGWRGRWSDNGGEWTKDAAIASALSITCGSQFLVPVGPATSEDAPVCKRPQLPLWRCEGDGNSTHDGTFVMLFSDFAQVFSHVQICRAITPGAGWTTLCLDGCWTSASCGGTPVPVRDPVLATLEDWGRNPQCRFTFLPSAEAGDTADEVDALVLLMQADARLRPGSAFPFEGHHLDMFLCASRLDEPGQRLPAFDKERVVRPPSSLSRRRAVLLKNRFRIPGSYALVPSTWEPRLPDDANGSAAFRLLICVRCHKDRFSVDAPTEEGWRQL
eukprot:TRINITY_DN27475_c0_g1_i1.p1 TRINITY_DN27475_c0_g1~~TRINITY_DN27475_c0_g1_i1.p1  ORF type:complete len:971 (+),score=108.21 TRINITY_DN27475_c0_g1_i1:112-3024(+)